MKLYLKSKIMIILVVRLLQQCIWGIRTSEMWRYFTGWLAADIPIRNVVVSSSRFEMPSKSDAAPHSRRNLKIGTCKRPNSVDRVLKVNRIKRILMKSSGKRRRSSRTEPVSKFIFSIPCIISQSIQLYNQQTHTAVIWFTIFLLLKYSVIQKDGLNFVRLYFLNLYTVCEWST